MNYVSLFSGGCGGDLAFQHLLDGFKCTGYVEIDDYCQRIIRQRQEDGQLHRAPIYGNIRTFIDSGCAKLYQGIVQLVTAGFPCQPFSVAGKQQGEEDPRNMWPATLRTIEIIRPRFAFLENVRGLLSSGYFQEILCGLHEIGYNARWTVLSAADCGAPHKRERLWILAYTKSKYCDVNNNNRKNGKCQISEFGNKGCKEDMADADCQYKQKYQRWNKLSKEGRKVSFRWNSCNDRRVWEIEPSLGRVAHGVANRVDRLKAIGNGQVSIVAATAWKILSEGLI